MTLQQLCGELPHPSAVPPNVSIRRLIHTALLPWKPSAHYLFDRRHRWLVTSVLLLSQYLDDRPIPFFPVLPKEIWFLIISFFGRQNLRNAAIATTLV
jgi:hypothetical protein